MKEEEREVLEAELSSLRHHLREAEAAIAVSERYLEDDHEVCQEKQIEKNPKSGASAEGAQTSGCNQHPDCLPWALPLWTLQSVPVGARCILIFLICKSSLSRQD